MSLVTDVLATVFVIQGVQSTVAAFQQVGQAQQTPSAQTGQGAANLANPLNDLVEVSKQSTTQIVAGFVAVERSIHAIAVAIEEATERYTEFGRQAMNIRDLTGGTGEQSAKLATVFGALGINDLATIREINRMSRDTLTPQGNKALNKLGVDPKGTNEGLSLINQIADGLEHMQNGIEKTALMQQIFGVRGVHNMLEYLRLTHDQRDALLGLSGVSEQNLEVIQRWQFANELMGATIEQKIIFPVLARLLPAFIGVVEWTTRLIDNIGKFNQATHGWAGTVAVIVAMGGAIGAMVIAVTILTSAFVAMNGVLMIQNAILAVRDALMGPAGWVALAAAGITVGVGAAAVIGFNNWQDKQKSTTQDRHAAAMERHTDALNTQTSTWQRLNVGGIPKGLNEQDAYQLARQGALGAIG